MRLLLPDIRIAYLAGALCLSLPAVAACDVRGLLHEDLFDRHDAGADGLAAGDSAQSDAAHDVGEGFTCANGSCAAGQFCDALTGRCASQMGTGMLSGVVRDACDAHAVPAVVGIAGRRQCAISDKASYFFSGLPLGNLKLAAAAEGYRPYDATVLITENGNVLDVAMVRDTPGGCADPIPAAVACSCGDVGCTE